MLADSCGVPQTCRINEDEDSPSLLLSSTTLALASTKIEPSLQANIDIKPLIFAFSGVKNMLRRGLVMMSFESREEVLLWTGARIADT